METSTLLVKGCKIWPMLGAQGFRAGRNLYRATPAVTRGLGFSSLIRRTTPFSHLLRHMRGCGVPILTRILMGHWPLESTVRIMQRLQRLLATGEYNRESRGCQDNKLLQSTEGNAGATKTAGHWIDWLFIVLRPAQEFFTYMETSYHYRWRVEKFRPMLGDLRVFEQGGIFIVPYLLWHGPQFFQSCTNDCPI
jgi:hypothetical protein